MTENLLTQTSTLGPHTLAFILVPCLALTGCFHLGIPKAVSEIQLELTAFKTTAGPDELTGKIAGG